MNLKFKLSALFALSLSMIILGGCMGGGGGSAETEYATVTATGTLITTDTISTTATLTDTSTLTQTTTVTQGNTSTTGTGWGVGDPIASPSTQQ
ncbi:MAG: hypothetical protein EOP11_12670 [Proteobacteria bacterium]|nr:MAG: hypothetical protein EOP11_12670 [Pseudomonadota bacterium]